MSWADFSNYHQWADQISKNDWIGALIGLSTVVVLAAMLVAEVDYRG